MREDMVGYGEVTHGDCQNCGKCDYDLFVYFKYTKILFFRLFERSHRYYVKCKSCGVYSEILQTEGRLLVERGFEDIESKRKRKVLIKNFLAAAVMTALILGFVLLIINTGDGRFKKLVADMPDGYYEVYDKDGSIWAAITKQKESRYDLLVKRERYEEDEYYDLEHDLFYEYYYYEQEDGLKYIESNAGVLLDKFGVPIQLYYYDTEEEGIFYYFGVNELDDIIYTSNGGVYNMTYYSDIEEKYTKVYAWDDNRAILMMFGSSLEWVTLYTLEGGRVKKYEYYDVLSESAEGLIDIPRTTEIGKAVEALSASGLKPVYSEEYIYYKDTCVIESIYIKSKDPGLGTDVAKQVDYIIVEKGGYYIVKPAADDNIPGGQVAKHHTAEAI